MNSNRKTVLNPESSLTDLPQCILVSGSGISESICRLTIHDINGSYTIPYIQSSPELTVRLEWRGDAESASIVVFKSNQEVVGKEVFRTSGGVTFERLARGEYDIEGRWRNRTGAEIGRTMLRRIGIGTVLAAIGDSITEGYYGYGFWRDNLDLQADMFPSDAVSKDGRNFPQFAPTSALYPQIREHYGQMVNCTQSWMTSLNDGLTDAWQQPVFIANEGWGGSTSASYLEMIQKDQGWRQRIRRLHPQVWLIHLGVNDERGKVAADIFSRNMEKIVDALVDEYQADPQMIFVAKPSYDYHPDAEAILNAYRIKIDGLVERREVRRGPDFFSAYSNDKENLYGSDQAHPNPTGITLMAELWAKALLSSLPKGCGA